MLNDEQLKYGFDYYFQDRPAEAQCVVELAEYKGGKKLSISCTQLDTWLEENARPKKDAKKILDEWCAFLRDNPMKLTELSLGTRTPQALFDAACQQKNLRKLEVKWGSYADLSAIENLQKLELLILGSGASVASIAPIAKLPKLAALSVENFQKVSSYAPLVALTKLESLSITGDGMAPRFIHLESIAFLRAMPWLRSFRLLTERLGDKDYTPILQLKQLEHLSLRPSKEVKALYGELRALPKLTWGLLVENPGLYDV